MGQLDDWLGRVRAIGARPVRSRHPISGSSAFGGYRLDSHPFPPTRLVEAGDRKEAVSESNGGNNLLPLMVLLRPYWQPVKESGAAATAIEKTPPDGVAVTSRLSSLFGVTDWSLKAPRTVTSPVTSRGM